MTERHDLVADIGGTNVRFALVDRATGTLSHRWSEPCRRHASLLAAAETYLAGVAVRPERACLALAGPIVDGAVTLTNSGWSAREDELAAALGLTSARFVNDFAALARALPDLAGADLAPIGGGRRVEGGAMVAVGPGTGLGVAGLVRGRDGWLPLASEGGHAGFAAHGPEEAALVERVRAELGRVSVERLVSGPGLARLHRLLAGTDGDDALSPAEIVARADAEPAAARALSLFALWLCRFAGDAALFFAARGGVFLGGGIAPRILPVLRRPEMRAAFEAKGRMAPFLAEVPLAVITAPDAGLRGAARCLDALGDAS